MKISSELLDILVCPDSKLPVKVIETSALQEINKLIEEGKLYSKSNKLVTEKMEAGLIREDGKVLYPIYNGIPILLVEEGILL